MEEEWYETIHFSKNELLLKPAFSTYFVYIYTHITHTLSLQVYGITTIGSAGRGSDQSPAHSTSGDPYSIIWMHAIQTPALCKLIASNWKTFSASPDPHTLLLSPLPHCQSQTLICPVSCHDHRSEFAIPLSLFLCFSVSAQVLNCFPINVYLVTEEEFRTVDR